MAKETKKSIIINKLLELYEAEMLTYRILSIILTDDKATARKELHEIVDYIDFCEEIPSGKREELKIMAKDMLSELRKKNIEIFEI